MIARGWFVGCFRHPFDPSGPFRTRPEADHQAVVWDADNRECRGFHAVYRRWVWRPKWRSAA